MVLVFARFFISYGSSFSNSHFHYTPPVMNTKREAFLQDSRKVLLSVQLSANSVNFFYFPSPKIGAYINGKLVNKTSINHYLDDF